MKFKKKIQMFEDFASSADASNSTTPSSATTKTTVSVDKTNTKSGEAIRQEVIKDVDTILTNLAELSNQITEDLNTAFEEILSEDLDLIVEAGAGDELMKMFKSMNAFTKLASSYGKLADKKKQLETDKKVYGYTFTLKKDEIVNTNMDKQKDAINAKIEKIDDPAKRKEARITRDAKLEEIKAKLSKKADQQKEDKDRGFDRDISDTNDAITKLTGDNKIESPVISAKWDTMKLSIDRKLEDKYIKSEREAISQFEDDPERMERLEKAMKERVAKENAEAAKALEAAKARAEKEQAELDEKIANADEDTKEALEKIKAFNTAYTELASKLDLDETSGEDEINAAKEASSNLDTAIGALGTGVMKKAFGYDNDTDADTALSDFTEREAELQSEYKANKALTKGSKEDDDLNLDDDQAKSAEEIAKEALGDQFDAHQKISDPEEMTPEQTDDEGNVIAPAKKKWKDVKSYKGKDAEGNDTDEEVMYALPNDTETESVNVPISEPLTESFAFKSGSVADRFRSLI